MTANTNNNLSNSSGGDGTKLSRRQVWRTRKGVLMVYWADKERLICIKPQKNRYDEIVSIERSTEEHVAQDEIDWRRLQEEI